MKPDTSRNQLPLLHRRAGRRVLAEVDLYIVRCFCAVRIMRSQSVRRRDISLAFPRWAQHWCASRKEPSFSVCFFSEIFRNEAYFPHVVESNSLNFGAASN
jgi:hypothetical protein